MAYEAILTSIGAAKVADAIANAEPITIGSVRVGDGGGSTTTPSSGDTELVNEVYSAAPNTVYIDPLDETRVICELMIPINPGGWWIREIGVFDAEGDLLAISQHPEAYKPSEAEGGLFQLVARVFMQVSPAAITLVIDPSAVIASQTFVSNAINNLIPGGTTNQVLTKDSNTSGDYSWKDPLDVSVNVDTIEEVQTIGASQTVFNLATVTTTNLAIYIEGIRLLPTDWTATDADTVTLGTTYPAGQQIHFVQNEPTGNTSFLQTAQNLNDVPDKAEARDNLGLLSDVAFLNSFWQLMQQRTYPVGEIFTTRQAGNPSSILGFGTWEPYAQGRVLVGHDSADAAFNEVDKTGGAKVHQLTVAEMPAHTHTVPMRVTTTPGSSTATAGVARANTANPEVTSSTGGNQAHNNLQPYITVFMWKRTA